MNIKIPQSINKQDSQEIKKLLTVPQNERSDLEQMWYLMDLVWDDIGCENTNLDWDKIGKFYAHPIWLLNGLFTEQHNISLQNRQIISDWAVSNIKAGQVLDYGRGFGALAKIIAGKNNKIQVDIFEPYPNSFAIKSISQYKNITILSELNEKQYDCVIATDVLEHVPDPLKLLSQMIESVKIGGTLIIANCFYPVIKCHLPQTFHLRYSFDLFASMMNLRKEKDIIEGYAKQYKKVSKNPINFRWIRVAEKLSKISFPVIEVIKPIARPIYHIGKNLKK